MNFVVAIMDHCIVFYWIPYTISWWKYAKCAWVNIAVNVSACWSTFFQLSEMIIPTQNEVNFRKPKNHLSEFVGYCSKVELWRDSR